MLPELNPGRGSINDPADTNDVVRKLRRLKLFLFFISIHLTGILRSDYISNKVTRVTIPDDYIFHGLLYQFL